jgi:hypothetical protein
MKILLTETQLRLIKEDYKQSAPRAKSITKIYRDLNSTKNGKFSGPGPNDKNLLKWKKEEEDAKKRNEELRKEREIERNLRDQQQKEKDERDNLEKSKSKEELEKIKNDERLNQYEGTILSILSELGKVDGEMKIRSLVNDGKMDGNIVKYIMDKIERQHEKMKTIYRKFNKYKANDIVSSNIDDGSLDSQIVKYIRLYSIKLRGGI